MTLRESEVAGEAGGAAEGQLRGRGGRGNEGEARDSRDAAAGRHRGTGNISRNLC